MAEEWYIELGGERVGPYSSAQLKELAGSSQITPETIVCRGDKRARAGDVKGLFAFPAPLEHGDPPTQEHAANRSFLDRLKAASRATTFKPNKSDAANGCGCVFFVLAMLWVIGTCSPDRTNPANPDEGNRIAAWVAAQDFVTRQLKSPATAEFPWYSESFITTTLNEGEYVVLAYVDAQNGFGALVRNRFRCTVSTSDGKNWKCKDIKIWPH